MVDHRADWQKLWSPALTSFPYSQGLKQERMLPDSTWLICTMGIVSIPQGSELLATSTSALIACPHPCCAMEVLDKLKSGMSSLLWDSCNFPRPWTTHAPIIPLIYKRHLTSSSPLYHSAAPVSWLCFLHGLSNLGALMAVSSAWKSPTQTSSYSFKADSASDPPAKRRASCPPHCLCIVSHHLQRCETPLFIYLLFGSQLPAPIPQNTFHRCRGHSHCFLFYAGHQKQKFLAHPEHLAYNYYAADWASAQCLDPGARWAVHIPLLFLFSFFF